MRRIVLILCAVVAAAVSCNRNAEIVLPAAELPCIRFEEQSLRFEVKTRGTLRLAPEYLHADGARYEWSVDGRILSAEPVLVYLAGDTPGTVYLRLEVTTPAGRAAEEIRIDVVERVLPLITLPGADRGFDLAEGQSLLLEPAVAGALPFEGLWLVDGDPVSREPSYLFRRDEAGTSTVTFRTENEDGGDEIRFQVRVFDAASLPFGWEFDREEYTFAAGRRVRLAPARLYCAEGAVFEWFDDGGALLQRGAESGYVFSAAQTGDYGFEVRMIRGGLALSRRLMVHVVEAGRYYRPRTASSRASCDRIWAYTPAPGQFVNAAGAATAEEACRYAEQQLDKGGYVSLGAFGGCLVAGFDHSVDASDGGYDLAIGGNAFDTSSEPGVVWVMQDENGDMLPNDTWYELRGSDYGAAGTVQAYEVTYYRPATAESDILWTDNLGGRGTVDHNAFHGGSYYPAWIGTDRYTLVGTRLENRAEYAFSEIYGDCVWMLPPFDWGYADNFSAQGRDGTRNLFRISDAVNFDGTPAGLEYVDFVKVQCAVQGVCGPLGEVSTEVTSIEDWSMR